MWEEAFPLLDQHFFQLVPAHLYEQFLDDVLRALQFASSFDQTGQQLTQYIILFFPREMKRYRAQKYMDKVSSRRSWSVSHLRAQVDVPPF